MSMKYETWIKENGEKIVEAYGLSEPDAPESIYEMVLDDDYPDTYNEWIEELELEDVPDSFIQGMYDKYMTNGMYDKAQEDKDE